MLVLWINFFLFNDAMDCMLVWLWALQSFLYCSRLSPLLTDFFCSNTLCYIYWKNNQRWKLIGNLLSLFFVCSNCFHTFSYLHSLHFKNSNKRLSLIYSTYSDVCQSVIDFLLLFFQYRHSLTRLNWNFSFITVVVMYERQWIGKYLKQ